MSHKKWRFHAYVLTAVLLGTITTGRTARVGAQEPGGLFTTAALPAQRDDQARPQGMGEVRSRAVGLDVSRLPSSVAADRADRLTLNLFDDVQLVAEIDKIETTGDATVFIGHLEGLSSDVAGSKDNAVTLVVADGVMIGSINTPTQHFQVRFDGQSHIVREVDPRGFPDEIDPTPSATLGRAIDDKTIPGRDQARVDGPITGPPPTGGAAAAGAAAADPGGAADTGARTDVMVLYTATARAAAGGTAAIRNLITLGVTETNTAYDNSGIGTRMRLVQMLEVAYAESGDAETDRNRLFNGADGHLDFVHTWRNTYGADMVQMLVNNAGSGCGIAYLNGPAASMAGQSAYAYAVTDWQCVSPNYTFAHEFGHIQGANHAPEDPTGTGAYSYSFGFKRCNSTPYFRSIMAYACPSGATGTQRSLYFSNPSVNFNGAPTGTATQNNALTLHNTRTIIGNFRQEQYTVHITSQWPPVTEQVGQTTRLWAYVVNDGPYPLPAAARVWFWTDGPGASSGEGWVGSAALTGLAPGSGAWYYYDFTIPADAAPGAWVYWARVWDGTEYLSDWRGPQGFTVQSVTGSIVSLWPVPVTTAGNTATLWARAQNTGTGTFPAGTAVWFWVAGPGGFSQFVGSTSVAGLTPGAAAWYSFNYSIPPASPGGAYNYWAILRYNSGGVHAISPWSSPQAFTVTAAQAYSANVDSLWTVSKPGGGAPERGFPVRLWALVRNNGLNVHDANTFVYYLVTGPGINQYVGSATTNGLASGASQWRSDDWTIPAAAPLGAYSYRAIVWRWNGAWQQLSGFSAPQAFNVASDQALPVAAASAPDKK